MTYWEEWMDTKDEVGDEDAAVTIGAKGDVVFEDEGRAEMALEGRAEANGEVEREVEMRVEDVMRTETEDVVAARGDAEVVVEGGGEGGRDDEGGTSTVDLGIVGGAEGEDEVVCDDVVGGTGELAGRVRALDMSGRRPAEMCVAHRCGRRGAVDEGLGSCRIDLSRVHDSCQIREASCGQCSPSKRNRLVTCARMQIMISTC
jgi:hypothetical protein